MAEDKEKKTPEVDEDEVEKAQKEMEELLKSLQEEVGVNNVKVVKVELPQPNLKNYFLGLLVSIIINTLLIVGTSGFIKIFEYQYLVDLVFFAIYFSIMERTINYLFIKLFLPLIIRTMGLANLIPYVISIVITALLPVFVTSKNLFLVFIFLVFVCIVKTIIHSFLKKKIVFKKTRRKK